MLALLNTLNIFTQTLTNLMVELVQPCSTTHLIEVLLFDRGSTDSIAGVNEFHCQLSLFLHTELHVGGK